MRFLSSYILLRIEFPGALFFRIVPLSFATLVLLSHANTWDGERLS